jgi:hypothetical protein
MDNTVAAETKDVVIAVPITPDEHEELKIAAIRQRTTVKEFTAEALREKIARLAENSDLT